MATGTLQHEIRRSRPFRSPAQEALLGLLRTADLMRRALVAVIEPHGVTFQQYNVLRILRGAGEDGLPTLEIAHRMIEQAPGITRLLDRLEGKDLVRRRRCPEDRRQVLCSITGAGRRLLAELDEPVTEADETTLAMLDAGELRELIRLLDTIRNTYGAAGDAAS